MKLHTAQLQVVHTHLLHVNPDTRPALSGHRTLGQIQAPGAAPLHAVQINGIWYEMVREKAQEEKLTAALENPLRYVEGCHELTDELFDNAKPLVIPPPSKVEAATQAFEQKIEAAEKSCCCGACWHCLVAAHPEVVDVTRTMAPDTAAPKLKTLDELKTKVAEHKAKAAQDEAPSTGFAGFLKKITVHRDIMPVIAVNRPEDDRVYHLPRGTALLLETQNPPSIFGTPYEGVKVDNRWFTPASPAEVAHMEKIHVVEAAKQSAQAVSAAMFAMPPPDSPNQNGDAFTAEALSNALRPHEITDLQWSTLCSLHNVIAQSTLAVSHHAKAPGISFTRRDGKLELTLSVALYEKLLDASRPKNAFGTITGVTFRRAHKRAGMPTGRLATCVDILAGPVQDVNYWRGMTSTQYLKMRGMWFQSVRDDALTRALDVQYPFT